jgi:hypothetical protein
VKATHTPCRHLRRSVSTVLLPVLLASRGYASKGIDLPNVGTLAVLPATHGGMHDLQFNGDSPVWQWTGKDYEIPKADLPQSNMDPWKTAQAPGRPLMAYVTPIDSVIKRVFVACEQGRPLLMLLTRQPLPAGARTLTFVFNGWTVNVPLQRNVTNRDLWMADLSRSQIPLWLAHPRLRRQHASNLPARHPVLLAHQRRNAGANFHEQLHRGIPGRACRLLPLLMHAPLPFRSTSRRNTTCAARSSSTTAQTAAAPSWPTANSTASR